jgi:hypothetical protein
MNLMGGHDEREQTLIIIILLKSGLTPTMALAIALEAKFEQHIFL